MISVSNLPSCFANDADACASVAGRAPLPDRGEAGSKPRAVRTPGRFRPLRRRSHRLRAGTLNVGGMAALGFETPARTPAPKMEMMPGTPAMVPIALRIAPSTRVRYPQGEREIRK